LCGLAAHIHLLRSWSLNLSRDVAEAIRIDKVFVLEVNLADAICESVRTLGLLSRLVDLYLPSLVHLHAVPDFTLQKMKSLAAALYIRTIRQTFHLQEM
jgi:hypothetical protein